MESGVSEIVQSIPDAILDKWQGIVDIMAVVIDVPYAVIAKIDPPYYEIFKINAANPKNLKAGDGCLLNEVYCEFVFRTRKKLLIPNALLDDRWCDHPEVSHGFISYLGFPILLPSGEVFGTICILDTKANSYGHRVETIIQLFKDQIETHLALHIQNVDLEDRVKNRTRELTDANRQLLLEINERKRAYSQLQESEDRFRSLVENSPVGIAISRGNKIVYQNPEHRRILGPVPAEIGFPYISSIHPDDMEHIKSSSESFLNWETNILNAIFRVYPFGAEKKSQNLKWIQCRAIHINYDKQDAVLATLVDITRSRELEHLMRIEGKMSALGRIATGIGHEILSPLSAINMNLSTLRDACLSDEAPYDEQVQIVNQVSARIKEAINRIEAISRNLNDFAKPSVPQLMAADLNRCIEKALELCASELRKNKVNLHCQLIPVLASCAFDPQMIEEVLLNLINNSLQALQKVEGTRQLAISSESGQDSILIRVADSGPGVPDELRDKIFEPFFTTKTDGIGIGLALAYRMVADHGGILSVDRSKWGGAEFTIKFPLNQGAGL